MSQINHFIVLLLENRSFDHLFGFYPPPAGEKIENLLGLDSPSTNLLDPSNPHLPTTRHLRPRSPRLSRLMTRKALRIPSTPLTFS
jgi:phosphoesterase family protein